MADEGKNDMPKSPSLMKLEMAHKIQMAEKEQENTWKSCCYNVNKDAVQYFTTIFIICGIMIFCIFKLTTDSSCEVQTAYMGVLTLLLGLVSPSPVFKKK